MTAKKLNRVNKMGVEVGSPSHSGSSDASFHTINDSRCIPFEIAAIDVRLVVVEVIEVS